MVSYLLGSIPFGYILVKIFLKQDIRETGSGNIRATNVARSGKKSLAIATLLLDALKGFAAVFLAPPIFSEFHVLLKHSALLGATAALFAVLGHMFPIWLRFKGGKGVATGVGAFVALAPTSIGVALILFVTVVAIGKYVSLGSIVAAMAFPILAHFLNGYSGFVLMLVTASSLLIVLKHHKNIRRLIAGTENKLGAKPTPPPQEVEKQ